MASHDIKRKHHYLPRWYLAGFTPSGREDDSLLVFDLAAREIRSARPETVGYENWLYAVNVPWIRLDAFEDLLADEYDSPAATALKRTCVTCSLLPDDREVLVEFASLLIVRSPRFRLEIESGLRECMGKPLEQAVDDLDSWQWVWEYASQPGSCSDPGYRRLLSLVFPSSAQSAAGHPSRDDVAAGLSRLGGADVKAQLWRVLVMWVTYPMLAANLNKKVWSLRISDVSGEFVCSDSPVRVAWSEDQVAMDEPKYADMASLVTLPLDRHTVAVAGLDDSPTTRAIPIAAVAQANSQTIRRAARFLFAPSTDCPFSKSDGEIGICKDVFCLISK